MLFWILMFLPLLVLLICLCVSFMLDNFEILGIISMADILFTMLCWFPIGSAWVDQADNIGTIDAQNKVIVIYQQQITSLTQELQQFHYAPGTLLIADSPVASVVKSLTEVQEQLTDAEVTKAKAMVSIEQRRHGPLSGVIQLVGDYPHEQ